MFKIARVLKCLLNADLTAHPVVFTVFQPPLENIQDQICVNKGQRSHYETQEQEQEAFWFTIINVLEH